jgi:hypothetical protein
LLGVELLTDVALGLDELTDDGAEQAANNKLKQRPVRKAPVTVKRALNKRNFCCLLNVKLPNFMNEIHFAIKRRTINLIISLISPNLIKYYKSIVLP